MVSNNILLKVLFDIKICPLIEFLVFNSVFHDKKCIRLNDSYDSIILQSCVRCSCDVFACNFIFYYCIVSINPLPSKQSEYGIFAFTLNHFVRYTSVSIVLCLYLQYHPSLITALEAAQGHNNYSKQDFIILSYSQKYTILLNFMSIKVRQIVHSSNKYTGSCKNSIK